MKALKLTVMALVSSLMLTLFFQNCAEPLEDVGTNSNSSLSGPDTSRQLQIISPEFSRDPRIPLVASNSPDNKDVISPKQILEIENITVIQAPAECEATCKAQLGCDSITDTTEKAQCNNSCNRDTGMCAGLDIVKDPYVLDSFTIPTGYKKAEIELVHCTDRQDVLVMEGPFMSFKTLNPAQVRMGQGWQRRNGLGANVGRGPRCLANQLYDNAKVKIKTTNDQGTLNAQKEYVWKMPAALGFSFIMIEDVEWDAPVFMHLKSVKGPGVKIHKIYDNYLRHEQLSFLIEYYFWYDPKYVTTFDFWYKKKTTTSSVTQQ